MSVLLDNSGLFVFFLIWCEAFEISAGYLCFGLFFVLHVLVLFFLLISYGFGFFGFFLYILLLYKGELDFGKRQFELCV